MSEKSKEYARFDARLSKEQKSFFEKAAAYGGYRSLTDFVILTVQSKAKELASTLNEDGTYFIYGKKLKRLSETEVFLIVNQVYYSPGTEISKDAIFDTYNFNIGDILCEIDSVKTVNKY
jgi:hypothetical protein